MAVNLTKYYTPPSTAPLGLSNNQSNFAASGTKPLDMIQLDYRIEHSISPHQCIFGIIYGPSQQAAAGTIGTMGFRIRRAPGGARRPAGGRFTDTRTPQALHFLNAPSPAATESFAIGSQTAEIRVRNHS